MTKTIRYTSAVFGLSLLMVSSMTHARDYLIEVVIFETVAGQNLNGGGLYLPRIEGDVRIGTEKAVTSGFLPVEQNLTLSQNAADIAASSRYRLLRHLSWRQPGLSANEAIAVRVALGDTVPMYIPDDLSSYPEFFPGTTNPGPANNNAVNTSVVNGTIKVRLGRFLHMDTRLVFTDSSSRQSFRLAQSRKMRSGELHYIDNPRFGLLTRITPLEDKALEPSVDESSEEAVTAPE